MGRRAMVVPPVRTGTVDSHWIGFQELYRTYCCFAEPGNGLIDLACPVETPRRGIHDQERCARKLRGERRWVVVVSGFQAVEQGARNKIKTPGFFTSAVARRGSARGLVIAV